MNNIIGGLMAMVIAGVVVVGLVPLVVVMARRFGVLDVPGGRKAHARATPLLGGMTLVVGWILGTLVVGGISTLSGLTLSVTWRGESKPQL